MGTMKDKWIEQMEPKPDEWERRWIPVSERLPEEGELVLWIEPADEFWPYFVGRRDGDAINWGENYIGIEPFVTHWMPLPEPPEVK